MLRVLKNTAARRRQWWSVCLCECSFTTSWTMSTLQLFFYFQASGSDVLFKTISPWGRLTLSATLFGTIVLTTTPVIVPPTMPKPKPDPSFTSSISCTWPHWSCSTGHTTIQNNQNQIFMEKQSSSFHSNNNDNDNRSQSTDEGMKLTRLLVSYVSE